MPFGFGSHLPQGGYAPFREQLVEIGSQKGPVLSKNRYSYFVSPFHAEKNGVDPESVIPQKIALFSSMI
jgi:hypothetical protein